MAMFLPPSISIDVWFFLEPQCEPPSDPAADGDSSADTGEGSAETPRAQAAVADAAAASSLAMLDPAAPSDADGLFPGYRMVPTYYWHFEDNAFSMPWQRLLEDANDDRPQEPGLKPRADKAAHGADSAAAPADDTEGADWGHP